MSKIYRFIAIVLNSLHQNPYYLIDYVIQQKNNKNVSLIVKQNEDIIVSINPNEIMPPASMAKLLIAIEFAKQCEENKINPNEDVKLSELDLYFIKGTDGGAHEKWLKSLNNKNMIQDGRVKLEEIARGMIRYSSNANSDYLIERLGIDNINQTIKQLGLVEHQEMSYYTASIYVAGLIQKRFQLTEGETLKVLKSMSKDEFKKYTIEVHNLMKKGSEFQKLNIPLLAEEEIQKICFEYFSGGSAGDYLKIIEKLNRKDYFSKTQQQQQQLDRIIESPSVNEKEFIHTGQKSGNTESILTNSLYVKDSKGNYIELVFMAKELEYIDMIKLNKGIDEFRWMIMKSRKFREQLVEKVTE
ncbi:serine hydrolase [Bacillus cereus group sp. BfR-BA-01331]|uniref:serine hydrolase n=1 Tax=Bacillus cereus group sp. BfR-BA-01331 TaxID=2920307 RepID=UPI001F584359|nr:serine hydrolase [Bacillus cereus group sp. BfR-BA-01331]